MKIKTFTLTKLRGTNIPFRLGAGFTLMALIPLLALGFFAYRQGSDAMYGKMSNSITQTVDQISVNTGYQLQSIINDGIDIAYSDLVQNTLIRYDKLTSSQLNNTEKELSNYINRKYIFNRSVDEVTLFTNEQRRINAYGPSDFRFLPTSENLTKLLDQIGALDGRPLWMAVEAGFEERLTSWDMGERKSILLGRVVKSLENGNPIGYMLMRMDESILPDLYRDIEIGENTRMFIVNGDGTVISSAGDYADVALPYPDADLTGLLKQSTDGTPFEYDIGGEAFLAAHSQIPVAGWHIVALVPHAYLYSESYQLLKNIAMAGLFIVLFALLVNLVVSLSIVRPIRQLAHGIGRFMQGDFNVELEESGQDEITKLTRSFNTMTSEIRNLIEDIRTQENQKRELEIRVLQAQINPHFLSNTLQTVAYLASLQNADNIESMVNSIIVLLSACMKNDSSLVTVREEISLTESYAVTQKYRLFGQFDLRTEISPEAEPLLVPRFLLQPIVENSLIHGIEPTGKQGLIVVKGHCEDGVLVFSVTDNGIGMTADEVEKLLSGESQNRKRRFSGIGVANVNERIRLLYGKEYGLTISSIPDVFTTVQIRIPMVKEGDGHGSNLAG